MMTPAVAVEYAVRLDCCAQQYPANPRHIVLPHRSLLGTFEYPLCQPSGEWPATFLCLRHGQSFVCSDSIFRLEAETPVQGQPPLWRVQALCKHEGCEKMRTIFVGLQPDALAVRTKILKLLPVVPCDGHSLEWAEGWIQVHLVAHNFPMR